MISGDVREMDECIKEWMHNLEQTLRRERQHRNLMSI